MHVKCQNIITVNPLLSPLGGGAYLFQAQLMGGLTEVRESGRGGGGVIIKLEKTMVSAVHKELDWRLCSQGSESSPNFSACMAGAKRGYPFRRLLRRLELPVGKYTIPD